MESGEAGEKRKWLDTEDKPAPRQPADPTHPGWNLTGENRNHGIW